MLGCSPEQQMMYAGSMKSLVNEIGLGKVCAVQHGFVPVVFLIPGLWQHVSYACISDCMSSRCCGRLSSAKYVQLTLALTSAHEALDVLFWPTV